MAVFLRVLCLLMRCCIVTCFCFGLTLVCFCCWLYMCICFFFFFFQAEDGIRDPLVTGVQTCALPILVPDMCRNFCACSTIARTTSGCEWPVELTAIPAEQSRNTLPSTSSTIAPAPRRSEERRVGKECRSRGAPDL